MADNAQAVLARAEIGTLIDVLSTEYDVIGPVARDGAIVYDRVTCLGDLPAGWTDDQEKGRYRLAARGDGALFAFVVGPQSWKKYLHPAELRLFSADRRNGTMQIAAHNDAPKRRRAFLGVRACELAAIAVQDRVLLQNRYPDPAYAARRDGVFIVAVQCTRSAPTCFCASMRTGPAASGGFDLALTEIGDRYLVDVGSAAGAAVLATVRSEPASEALRDEAEAAVRSAATAQIRTMDTSDVGDVMSRGFDHPRWDDVAARCLSCANCTLVCPTCFCTTVEDVTSVTGDHAERWRRWDSCFTAQFSYIHGGNVRASVKSRYRQWMTHKLASWVDQFGLTGCVGCGRCIAWCPAGIDITEELQALRGTSNGNT